MTSSEPCQPACSMNEATPSVVYHPRRGEKKVSDREVQRLQDVLFAIIKASIVGKADQNYTHNAQNLPRGKYFIDAQAIEKYYSALCNLVEVDGMCGMMEKNEPLMPVIVDNDWDFPPTSSDNTPPILYEPWVITEQIKVYQDQIRACCKDATDKSLICCVFEKTQGYMKKGYIHNGFHLMFPFAVINADDQQRVLNHKVKELLKQSGLLERMKYKDIKLKGLDEILDPGLPAKTWVQYGCRKDNNSEPYKLTGIYNHQMEKISVADTFNPSECWFVNQKLIPLSFFSGHPPEYYLPLYLSVRAWSDSGILEIKEEARVGLPPAKVKKPKSQCTCGGSASTPCETCLTKAKQVTVPLFKLQQVVGMLSATRADGYPEWWSVGCAIYNSSGGSKEGFELWDQWSRLSSKYDEDGVEKAWEGMTVREGGLSIGSLRKWAEEDSPEKYAVWKKEDNRERAEAHNVVPEGVTPESTPKPKLTITRSDLRLSYEQEILLAECDDGNLGLANYGIAVLTKKSKYTMTPAGEIVSYSWNEETKLWVTTESGSKMQFFKETLVHLKPVFYAFDRMADEADKSASVQANRIAHPNYLVKHAGLKSFLGMCRNGVQHNIVWQMIVDGLTGRGKSGMNHYSDWLPLKGGNKISLRTGEIIPRTRDDLWSYEINATGINCSAPAKAHVRRYFTNICRNAENQVDEDFIKYIRKLLGYFLTYEKSDKGLYFFTGCGDSGKSELVQTMTAVVTKNRVNAVETEVFVKSGSKSNHQTHLYELRGLSLAYVQEIPSRSILNADILKALSGGDEIKGRACHAKKGEDVESDAHLAVFSNGGIIVDGNDSGIKNRAKYIPINRDLVHLPPGERRDNQVMLKYLKETQDGLNALLCFYVEGSIEYFADLENLIERIELPKIVKDHTNEFITDNDSFTHFLEEKCDVWTEASLEPKASYTFARSALQTSYKLFCQTYGYEKDQVINAKTRLCQLTKVSSSSQGAWVGVRSKVEVLKVEDALA